jgi:hypothetical protein
MATTRGLISFKGTIGDHTFYRTKNGTFIRQKTSLTKDKIMNGPEFIRVRENMAEFGASLIAGKFLRKQLLPFIGRCRNGEMPKRINGLLLRAIKLDKVNPKGKRNVLDGELSLLQDFEFNNTTSLPVVLHTDITASFERSTGEASVSIASFVPESALVYMPRATHARISMAAAAVNFTTQQAQKQFFDSDYLPISKQPTGALTLSVSLPANLTDPVLLLLKLQYFEEVNGDMLERCDASCNTCTILKVDTGA